MKAIKWTLLLLASLAIINYGANRGESGFYPALFWLVCFFASVLVDRPKKPNQPKGDTVIKGTPSANKVSKS